MDSAINLLNADRADLFAGVSQVVGYNINKLGFHDQIIEIPNIIDSAPFNLCIGKNSPYKRILPEFDETIKKMRQDGSLQKIYNKHKTFKHFIVCSTDNSEGSLHVFALKKFDELARKYSNDRIATKIHYRGNKQYPAIKGEEANVNMVMHKKELHLTVVASGNASVKMPVLEFLMLPYMFPDISAAKRLFRSDFMKRKINQVLKKRHNVRAVGWLIGGYRHMTNSKLPVTRLEDMKGLTIRTPGNQLMRETYQAFGCNAKPLKWSKTFAALLDGTVDGQENPYNVIFYSRFWEANQKYVTNNGPFLWLGPILINNDFFETLPEELQLAVLKAGAEASELEWQWIAQEGDAYKKILSDKGMQILELEDKSRWEEATKPLWENFYSIIGYGNKDKGRELVEKAMRITTKQRVRN